jgi:hypothetical protein
MEKVGRNDPCPCGSGKKFKKCCESKMLGKRFSAHKIEDQNIANRAVGVSNLFQSRHPQKSPDDSGTHPEKS